MKLSITFLLFVTLKSIVFTQQDPEEPSERTQNNDVKLIRDVSNWIMDEDLKKNCKIKKIKQNDEITGYEVQLKKKTFKIKIGLDKRGEYGELRMDFLNFICAPDQVIEENFSDMDAFTNYLKRCIRDQVYGDKLKNVEMKYSNTVLTFKFTKLDHLSTILADNVVQLIYSTINGVCHIIPVLEREFPGSKKWFSAIRMPKIL